MAITNQDGSDLGIILIEYSPSQRMLNITPLANALESNITAITSGRMPDFVTVGVVGNSDAASRVADQFRNKFPHLFTDLDKNQ